MDYSNLTWGRGKWPEITVYEAGAGEGIRTLDFLLGKHQRYFSKLERDKTTVSKPCLFVSSGPRSELVEDSSLKFSTDGIITNRGFFCNLCDVGVMQL